MREVETAIARINDYVGRKFYVGPRDVGLIVAAQDALGIQFPPSYRMFLEQLGAGSIRGREVYGIVDGDFRDSSIPDGIWLTLREREDSGLPQNLVIVYSTGDGDYVAIDTSRHGSEMESPLVLWRPGVSSSRDDLEEVSSNFGTFLLQLVREVTDESAQC